MPLQLYDILFLYIFLPVCMVFYFIPRRPRTRNAVMVLFSVAALAWGGPFICVLAVGSGAVNYLLGLGIAKTHGKGRGALTALGIAFDVGLLVMLRMSASLVGVLGFDLSRSQVPWGFAYLTLRMVSYLMDTGRGQSPETRSFTAFMVYVTMFPVYQAGPVTLYRDTQAQLMERSTSLTDFSEGLSRTIMGLGKYALIAAPLRRTLSEVTALSSSTLMGSWTVALLSMLTIYFEFSGYCDMALGLGRVFGFSFKENYRYPFMARSVRDFLGRFNGTFTAFWKQNLVKTGLFKGERRYAGVILACVLAGLWFGGSVSVIVTMLFFGLLTCVEMLIGRKRMEKLPKLLGHLYTKLCLILGFTMFGAGSLGKAVELYKGMAGQGSALYSAQCYDALMKNVWVIGAAVVLSFPIYPWVKKKSMERAATAYIYQTLGIILDLAVLAASTAQLIRR